MARTKTKEHFSTVNWNEIVSDFHSGDPAKVQSSKDRACKALHFFIINKMKAWYPTYIERENKDLIQSGYLGILEHLGEYDPQKGAPTTFFTTHIHQAMQLWLNLSTNQSSIHYQTANNKIQAAIRYFEANKIAYDDVKISEKTGVPVSTIRNALAIANKAAALEINEEIKTGEGDEILSPEAFGSPEDEFLVKERYETLYACMDKYLNEEEREVLAYTYGVGHYPECPIKEVAARLNMSVGNVKIIQTRAIRKLNRSPELSSLVADKYEDDDFWLDDEISYFPETNDDLQTAEFQVSDFDDLFSLTSNTSNLS